MLCQALQQAGLDIQQHAATLLILRPHTLSDALDSILWVCYHAASHHVNVSSHLLDVQAHSVFRHNHVKSSSILETIAIRLISQTWLQANGSCQVDCLVRHLAVPMKALQWQGRAVLAWVIKL